MTLDRRLLWAALPLLAAYLLWPGADHARSNLDHVDPGMPAEQLPYILGPPTMQSDAHVRWESDAGVADVWLDCGRVIRKSYAERTVTDRLWHRCRRRLHLD